MNQRERMLALAVGVLLLPFVLWAPYSWHSSAVQSRRKQIAELQKKVDDQQLEVERGKRAQQHILTLEERSLPYDKQNPELARSLYQSWLLGEVQKNGFESPKVTPLPMQDRGAYLAHGFTLSGRATLGQITQFLYDFYTAPHLHTIRSLRIRPVKEKSSKELELTVAIEAVSLPGAGAAKTLPQGKVQRLALGELKDYTGEIVTRNLFGPPNAAPKISSISTQKAYVGRSFSVSVRGSDSDKDDKLAYSLEPGAPAGAKIDPKSGELRWTPSSKGSFFATVRVADNGTPSKSATAKVEITVVDPPPSTTPVVDTPKKPSFDAARFTYVTTIAQDREGRREVWLKVRTTDQTIKLHEGDKFEVGLFKGEVVRIAEQDVELRGAGKRLLVALGENLDQAQPLPSGDL